MRPPLRPEYRQLLADFSMHAASFGVSVDARSREDLTTLLRAMDRVDDGLDGLTGAQDRARLARSVLARLQGEPAVVDGLEADLDALGEVLGERGCRHRFLALTQEALDVSERLRSVQNRRVYLAAVLEEGLLTPRMTLCVLGPQSAAFDAFLLGLGSAGNFVDELRDLRDDHRRGEKAIRPGLRVHLGLLAGLVRGTLAVLPLHPRPASVVTWGARHLLGRYPDA